MSISMQPINNINSTSSASTVVAATNTKPIDKLVSNLHEILNSQPNQNEKTAHAESAVKVSNSATDLERAEKLVEECIKKREEMCRYLLTENPYAPGYDYMSSKSSLIGALDRIQIIEDIEEETRTHLREHSSKFSLQDRMRLWNKFNKDKFDSKKSEILKNLNYWQCQKNVGNREHKLKILENPQNYRGAFICGRDEYSELLDSKLAFSYAVLTFKEEVIYTMLNGTRKGTKTAALEKIYANIVRFQHPVFLSDNDYDIKDYKAALDKIIAKG